MRPEMDYSLYVCTDRDIMTTDTLEEAVELAIKGGATIIQLREKDCTSREFYELALSIKDITDAYEVPLIINDRLDIALAVHADGVHLGPLALGGIDGDARAAEDIHIPIDGAFADFEAFRKLPGCDIGGIQQQINDFKKAVDLHGGGSFLYRRIPAAVLSVYHIEKKEKTLDSPGTS